jgi:choloylglycine hydrolase
MRWLVAALLLSGAALAACTSVCLTRNGRVVFGNNLDWHIGDAQLVINKRNVAKRGAWSGNAPQWVSKYGSITTNLHGDGFNNRGMNEAGLVIGEMSLAATVYPERDARPMLSQSQWIQYQLDNCATVGEVLATDAVVRIDRDEFKSHFLVCDASGECATMEWLGGRLRARRGDTLAVKALVNTTYEECLARGDDPSGRFARLVSMLDRYSDQEPVGYVFSMLEATSNARTKWSLVFDVNDLRLYYTTSENRAVRTVSLREFDMSCRAPVYVLDINAAGEGSVRPQFAPFTEAANTEAILNFYRQYGAPTPSVLNTILGYHATLSCTEPPPQFRGPLPRRGRAR